MHIPFHAANTPDSQLRDRELKTTRRKVAKFVTHKLNMWHLPFTERIQGFYDILRLSCFANLECPPGSSTFFADGVR